MATIACSPSNLKKQMTCLDCLSDKKVKAILVHVMKDAPGVGLTLPQVLTGSACYREQLSKRDMLRALAVMIINQLSPGTSVNTLVNSSKCLACGPDKQIDGALIYLFCNYFQTTAV